MSSIDQLHERLKIAQIELDRITQALYTNVNSPELNGRYTQAIIALDQAEAELEAAQLKFRRKF